jgi:hypothetical protein
MRIYLGLLLGFLSLFCQAQDEDYLTQPELPKSDFLNYSKRERVVVGGNLGLGLSTSSAGQGVFYGQLMPMVGYRVTERFSAGAGVDAMIYSTSGRSNFYTSLVGWSRMGILAGFYATAELNYMNAPVYAWNGVSYDVQRQSFPLFLVGAGISQGIGNGIGSYFSLLYDMTEDTRSPYGPIIFRAGLLVPLRPKN